MYIILIKNQKLICTYRSYICTKHIYVCVYRCMYVGCVRVKRNKDPF